MKLPQGNQLTYHDIELYVMSGTGNTYRVARWIKEAAENHDVCTKITMIDNVKQENLEAPEKDRLYGIMFPAHGLMAPWSMMKFLFQIPSGNNAPSFIISTRGGIKLGPVVIPGAVGFGNFLAAIILIIKRYRVKGLFSLDMPINLINVHWGMNQKNIEAILFRARNKLEPVINRLLSGKNVFLLLNNLWELAWTVLTFWLIPIFPILYLLIGKLYMAKLMFADNRCNGCGECARHCPNHGISMKQFDGKNRPFWTYHCEVCLRCMAFCKKEAIEAGHSWGVLLYYITSVPVIIIMISKVNLWSSMLSCIEGFWIKQLVEMIYIIPALIISYWIFWLLIRIPLVNTFFSYTTFTRYFRRYHEPKTRLKDLMLKE